MQRLTFNDAWILHQEETAPNTYMHSVRLLIVDPSEEPGGYSFERTKEAVARVLPLVPPMYWRVVPTPLGLHHPVWINDPEFNLDYHIRRAALPAPGGDRELAELFASFAERPLDRHRPLWDLLLVEGVEHGRVAYLLKVHHALADGVGFAQMLQDGTHPEPTPLEEVPEPPPYTGEEVPPPGRLVWLALKDLVRDVPPAMVALAKRRGEVKRAARQERVDRPLQMYQGPPTRFNGPLTPSRAFAFTSFSLPELKAVGAALGATINDVFLGLAAGALRAFLLERGELPDAPLVASVPINLRTGEQVQMAYGNIVGAMAVRLRTDIEDPRERLLATKHEADQAKADFRRTRGARLENVLEVIPPGARLMVRAMQAATRRGRPVLGNVSVSNVPGPREPLYLGQSRYEALYSVGPVVPGTMINFTGWSYAGQLNLSLLSCKETVPDLWPVIDLVRDAFSELQKLADELERTHG